MSEFERRFDPRHLPGKAVKLDASPAECAALARRFGLVAVESLSAEVELIADGPAVRANGRFVAQVIQSCAVSGEDLPVQLADTIALRFVPESEHKPDEEIELAAEDCDTIEFAGPMFDLGEEVAQSVALAIDPYLEGPGADEARRKAGIVDASASGPFAALEGLLKDN